MFGFDNGKRRRRVFQAGGLHEQGHRGQTEPAVSEVPWLRDHEDLVERSRGGPISSFQPQQMSGSLGDRSLNAGLLRTAHKLGLQTMTLLLCAQVFSPLSTPHPVLSW